MKVGLPSPNHELSYFIGAGAASILANIFFLKCPPPPPTTHAYKRESDGHTMSKYHDNITVYLAGSSLKVDLIENITV